MRRSWQTVLLTAILMAVAPAVRAEAFQIVAHPSVEGSTISRAVLAKIFQMDVSHWGDRTRILPVDQTSRAPVRQAFAREILQKSLGEVQAFWGRRVARSRILPPPTKASDEEVLSFVARKKGAIGYVRSEVEIPPGVKVLTLTD
jgi:ABC-type phosphate transport system substrate-binding protein